MSEKMILRFPVQPAKRAEFVAMMTGALEETRAYDGCLAAQQYMPSNSEGDVWVWEEWESKDHQAKYFNWRIETGMVDAIGPMMAGEPEIIWLAEPA